MAEITLIADTGRPTGSPASRRLRHTDRVPAVVYGTGVEPTSITVERRALRQALSGGAGINAVINLHLSGRSHPTVVKELQRDPLRRSVTHVDFLVVDLDVELEIEVPIDLIGEAKAVLAEQGLVETTINNLAVRCTPRHIPNSIPIDVSAMRIGDVVRVSDITLPAGVTCPLDPDTTVVTASATRAVVEERPAAPAEVVAEAEPTDTGG